MSSIFPIIVLVLFIGCAAPPRAITLSELSTTPEQYLDSTITFSGQVKESSYREGHYYAGSRSRLYLTITDGVRDIYGYMEGYDKGRVLRAVKLTEKAKKEEGEVTVTGRLTGLAPQTEVKFDRIRYKGEGVLISEDYFSSYRSSPHYGHHWHYPYGLFRHHRFGGYCD